ncbi:hypothetical protein ACFPH6_47355 [Streptomyces xiangluensis]|uniref:Peptidase family M41 n=1 Tax=Streptomyces xiangluensis TaxID=2665720 RepID=A0ABV8Z3N8_9ACTN
MLPRRDEPFVEKLLQLRQWSTYNDGTKKPLLTVALPYEAARRSACYHEAGHAVVTAAYGAHIKVTGVINLPTAEGQRSLTGRTEFDGPPIPFWRFAAQCAAGERAQVRYLKSAGLWSPDSQVLCANHDDFELCGAVGVRLVNRATVVPFRE